MDWTHPKSPWQRRVRKQQYVVMAAFTALPVVVVALLILLSRGPMFGRDMTWLGWILVVLVLAVIPFAVRAIRIFRRMLRVVPHTDGMVCPKCVVALQQNDDVWTCPSCERSFEGGKIAELRDMWRMLPNFRTQDAVSAHTSLVGNSGRLHERASLRLIEVMSRERTVGQIAKRGAVAIAAIAVIVLLSAFLIPGAPKATLLSMLPFIVIWPIGWVFIAMGGRVRRGCSLHCVECEYEWNDDAGKACPECGADWSQAGTLIRGRFTRRRALVVLGFAWLFLTPVMLIGVSFSLPRILPTSMLIRQATSDGLSRARADLELQRRSLTPAQYEELATRYIERIEKDCTDPFGHSWVDPMIANGMLTTELQQRYFRAMMRPVRTTPSSVPAGRYANLSLMFEGWSSGSAPAQLIIDRVTIGHEELAPFRGWTASNRVLPMIFNGNVTGLPLQFNLPPFSIDQPGEHPLTIHGWIARVPGGTPVRFQKEQKTGAPIWPDNAYLVEPFEFTTPLVVTERP